MNLTEAANDSHIRSPGMRPAEECLQTTEHFFNIPKGHVGPVLLSETGRTVWWTGRVAIGLRYEPPSRAEPCGQSALWVQQMLLKCG